MVTTYDYDDFKRVISTTKDGITLAYDRDPMGRITKTTRMVTNGSPMVLKSAAYDTAGRLASRTDARGNTTLFLTGSSPDGHPLKTISYPDGGSAAREYYASGALYRITGLVVLERRGGR